MDFVREFCSFCEDQFKSDSESVSETHRRFSMLKITAGEACVFAGHLSIYIYQH